MELSVVLPCLNEAESVGICIEKVRSVLERHGIAGEIVVADNGSTDGSVDIVRTRYPFVRLVEEPERGYGAALRRGIEAATGTYVLMADADDTYDFPKIPAFLSLLRQGYDLVMGSRFRGTILPGAMTWSHRYIGNPILSGILRLFFGGEVSDSHCGMRAFSREAYRAMNLHTTGMEFASEMVIHALKKKLRIAEVPVTYAPRRGTSKLVGFRDAWRHMRFMLIYSPNHLFLVPGALICAVGLGTLVRFLFGPIWLAGRNWDVHVTIVSAVLAIVGWQITTLGFAAKVYAQRIGLERSRSVERLRAVFTLERSLALGGVLLLSGALIGVHIVWVWASGGFGELHQVKEGLVALTLVAMGLQMVFTAFLVSMFDIKYR